MKMKQNKDCSVKGYLHESIYLALTDTLNTLGGSQSQFVSDAVIEKLLSVQNKVSQVKQLQNRPVTGAH